MHKGIYLAHYKIAYRGVEHAHVEADSQEQAEAIARVVCLKIEADLYTPGSVRLVRVVPLVIDGDASLLASAWARGERPREGVMA